MKMMTGYREAVGSQSPANKVLLTKAAGGMLQYEGG